jgi:hypothetical protein
MKQSEQHGKHVNMNTRIMELIRGIKVFESWTYGSVMDTVLNKVRKSIIDDVVCAEVELFFICTSRLILDHHIATLLRSLTIPAVNLEHDSGR